MATNVRKLVFASVACLLLVTGITALWPQSATAAAGDQITLFDDTNLVHSPTGTGNPYADVIGSVLANPVDNWVSPNNYRDGKVYFRLNVKTKPSNKLMFVQICFWYPGSDGTPFKHETCSKGTTFTNAGVVYAYGNVPSTWYKLPVGVTYDWARLPSHARVMIKDTNSNGKLMINRSCGGACYAGTDLYDHVPLVFDASMVMVKQGETFDRTMAPANWSTCPEALCGASDGGSDNTITSCPVTNSGLGTVSYNNRLQAATPAVYKAWLLMNVPSATRNKVELDTIKVGTNTTRCDIEVAGTSPGTWQWVAAPSTLDMPAGNHHVALTGKSSGVKVDKILFLTDLTCVPVGDDGGDCVDAGSGDLDWTDDDRDFRTLVTVNPSGVARTDLPVDMSVNFTSLFTEAGASGSTMNVNSLKVVEIDGSGAVIDDSVTHQFDTATGYNASTNALGNLVFIAEGATGASTPRKFFVYFDKSTKTFAAPTFTDQVVLTDGVTDEGFASYKLATTIGTWFYHKQGGGFSSLVDTAGNDWIKYNAATGAAGEFRGIPNSVFQSSPEISHFHPGKTTSASSIVKDGPIKTTFKSVVSEDGGWETKWEVYPRFARMTMVDKGTTNYWFLYEGTPGGTANASDSVMRANGSSAPLVTPLSEAWSGDIGGASGNEWVAFADSATPRSLFVANHQADSIDDSYRLMGTGADANKMTVFGFGRTSGSSVPLLSAVPYKFTVGLTDTSTASVVQTNTLGAYKDIAVTKSPAEARDSSGALSVTISVPAAGATLSGTTNLVASASDGAGPADSVQFFANGTLLGAAVGAGTTFTFAWDTAEMANGSYAITATAFKAGVPSVTSTPVTVTLSNAGVDTTPPVAAWALPLSGTNHKGTVALSATASDETAIERVEFWRGGSATGTLIGTTTSPSSGSTYTLSWDTTAPLLNLQTSVTAKAYDTAGNNRETTGTTLMIDNTAPSGSLTAPLADEVVSGSTTLTATATDPSLAESVPGSGVAKVEWHLDLADGVTPSSTTKIGEDLTNTYSLVWNTSSIASGAHTLRLVLTDQVGNQAIAAATNFYVDNTDPTATFTISPTPVPGVPVPSSITLSANANGTGSPVAKVEFFRTGRVSPLSTKTVPTSGSTYSFVWVTTAVASGEYNLTAKVTDGAGRTFTTPAQTVTVNNTTDPGDDTQPPTTPTNFVSTGVTDSTIALDWDASTDNVGVISYQLYRNGTFLVAIESSDGGTTPPATAFTDTGLVRDTVYGYRLEAQDAAGNVSSLTPILSVSTAAPARTADFNEDGRVCTQDLIFFISYLRANTPPSHPKINVLRAPTDDYTAADHIEFIRQYKADMQGEDLNGDGDTLDPGEGRRCL